MHICKPSDYFSPEQASFMLEELEEALGQAHDVLQRHLEEDLPFVDEMTTSEAAEAYSNLIATAKARIETFEHAKKFFEEVK